jgi:hypothetical protein
MGLRLFFLPNFPAAMFIQGATFIPDSGVNKVFFMAAVIKFVFSELLVIANNLIKRALFSANIPAILEIVTETCNAFCEIFLSESYLKSC